MKNLLNLFVKNFPWLIIGWIGFNIYNDYIRFTEDLASIKDAIPAIELKISKNKKRIEKTKEFKSDLEESKKRIEEVASQIESVQRQLPNKISDPEIMDIINNEANTLNIKNVYITPTDEIEKGFTISKGYNFKGQGTYLQFLILFDRLGENERLFNISTMLIEGAKDKQKGRFKLVNVDAQLETFKYNALYKESRGIDEIESKYGTSSLSAPSAPAPRPRRSNRGRKDEE